MVIRYCVHAGNSNEKSERYYRKKEILMKNVILIMCIIYNIKLQNTVFRCM